MVKYFLCIHFLIISLIALSQSADKKQITRVLKIGFSVGTNYAMIHSKMDLPSRTIKNNTLGGKFGIVAECAVSSRIQFAPKLELSLNNSNLEYTNLNKTHTNYYIFPIALEIISHFQFKPLDGKKLYILLGPNLRIPIRTKPNIFSFEYGNNVDLALDFGFGTEKILKYFVFAPEIRYSVGLFNINQNPIYQILKYHTIALAFNFKP
jgi:hypothetical protein